MVRRFAPGRALEASELSEPRIMALAVAVLRRCRDEMLATYRGPVVDRSPAAILPTYQALIASRPNRWRAAAARHDAAIAGVVAALARLPLALGHNDVHAANMILDGDRLWLVDWEYAGQAPALVDLGSLCVNGLMTEPLALEAEAMWIGRGERSPPRLFAAARLAAALRDLFWGYVQDGSGREFDADAYIAANEARVAVLSNRAS
jgi:aminoglycoside phosphotransferase (APT) family kinase protein